MSSQQQKCETSREHSRLIQTQPAPPYKYVVTRTWDPGRESSQIIDVCIADFSLKLWLAITHTSTVTVFIQSSDLHFHFTYWTQDQGATNKLFSNESNLDST